MTICVIFGSASFDPRSLKNVLERGNDPPEQHAADPEEDHADHARVDHGSAELPFELHALLVVDGEALENRVEDAAGLACLNEVAIEVIEDPGMPPERLAERLALLDLRFHVGDDDGKIVCCRFGCRGCRGTERWVVPRRSSARANA